MPRTREFDEKTRQRRLPPITGSHVMMVLVLAAAVVFYWWSRPRQAGLNPEQQPGVNQPLLFLSLQSLFEEGKSLSLDEISGRVVLLNFWGPWCGPCRKELPHLAEIHKRYAAKKDFLLLAVACPPGHLADDVRSLREEAAALLKSLQIELPVYYDPESQTRFALGAVLYPPKAEDKQSDIEGFPTTVLLDRHGLIRAVWVGYRRGAETEMERYIDTLLDEKE